MIVQSMCCESCGHQFRIPVRDLPPDRRSVHCVACGRYASFERDEREAGTQRMGVTVDAK